MPFVYILRCRDGSFYTGAAKDLRARVRQHEAGTASRYTRSRRPVVLVWSRRVRTWGRALSEEHRIKRLTRREKEALVTSAKASLLTAHRDGTAGAARWRGLPRRPHRVRRRG